MEKTFRVASSHGTIHAEVTSGKVVSIDYWVEGENCLDQIIKVDIGEFHQFYPGQEIEPHCVVDLCNIGFWYNEYHDEIGENEVLYEPADRDFRQQDKDTDTVKAIIKE